MTDDRYSLLAPASVGATLRSLPRRFRAALTVDPSVDIEDIATVPAANGRSLLDLLVDTTRSLAMLDRALERTVVSDHPALPAGVVDSHQREWPDEPGATIASELTLLDDVTSAMSSRIDGVAPADWLRKASIAGDGELTAQQVAQEAARTGAENLRVVERLVPELAAAAKRSGG